MLQAYRAVWCWQTRPLGTVHIDYLLNYSLEKNIKLKRSIEHRKVNPSGQPPMHSSSVED